MSAKKVIITIPTFNESENITDLITNILELHVEGYELQVLIIDDNSPDNTAGIVEFLKKKYPDRIHLLKRFTKKGRGYAGVAGFKEAMRLDADVIGEMDADFSHDPIHIPDLIKATEIFDMVLGSRSVHSGQMLGRPWYRYLITFLANLYIRIVFWISVWDCNSGFRFYRRGVFEVLDLDKVEAAGPSIVQEILYKVHQHGFIIGEIPVTFIERQRGKSSLTFMKLLSGYIAVLQLKWKHTRGRLI